MASVELTNIKKVYPGNVEAVRDVSLTVPNGSFTVLLGPSGCGKSTLLRMIAGLETITSGVCKIGERVVNDIEPAERDIAMVFQNYALYPHMSVYDNMAYGLKNRGTPKPEIEKRVREAASLLAIEDYLTRKPRALSGGQRQRVAMGRAIVREPQVFLFDEPLSNLDAKLRVTMRLEIKRLHDRLNATSIFVTHDQVEAMTLADQVVVMNAGKIEQIGAPGEVYKHPASRFVASFIGAPAMNLMPGKIAGAGIVETPGGKLSFDAARFSASGEVEAGIRPEDIRVTEGADGIPFKPELVEELGATRLLHGNFGTTPIIVAIPASGTTHENKEVRLTVDPAAVHLFDKATGRSLAR
ncbi:MAG: sn-glycerol-3-phosphate ABC transporter ATP-binding protein UgpC [Xanthobacteraceae bacterium]|nr:sn-glycerol-3-phosphate ABC transporter ATP-binding protein UgpC [Xanthobacteraceae bacterium]MCW5678377.1 sn-glycerol-3-phosphate ABC transporter ATP-binding protein UgpC [Xanthobacteraceae bacterium]